MIYESYYDFSNQSIEGACVLVVIAKVGFKVSLFELETNFT